MTFHPELLRKVKACNNGTLVRIYAQGTEIILPDGKVVLGTPHNTRSYRQQAEALGYGADTLSMCLDHDPLHALLSDWLGLPYSRSLYHGKQKTVLGVLEEQAVLAVQMYMRNANGKLPI